MIDKRIDTLFNRAASADTATDALQFAKAARIIVSTWSLILSVGMPSAPSANEQREAEGPQPL